MHFLVKPVHRMENVWHAPQNNLHSGINASNLFAHTYAYIFTQKWNFNASSQAQFISNSSVTVCWFDIKETGTMSFTLFQTQLITSNLRPVQRSELARFGA